MKLSIVIPVYNVEKFVADCMESCIRNLSDKQSEVEMIIVDDGSKDQSINIVQRIIDKVSCARIITQVNLGLSMARNNGMKEAKGEYIWFVDSDDFIADGIISRIISVINDCGELDILELEYEKVDEFVNRQDLKIEVNSNKNVEVITGHKRFLDGFCTPVQFHVFRREFLIKWDLFMYPGIFHEDSEFTPRALWKAEKVALLKGNAYFYRQRRHSIMTTPNPKKGKDYMFVAHRLVDYFFSQPMNKDEKSIVCNYIAMTYCNGLRNAIGVNKRIKDEINEAAVLHKIVLKALKHAKEIKYKILGYLASAFPKYIVNVYIIMMNFKVTK